MHRMPARYVRFPWPVKPANAHSSSTTRKPPARREAGLSHRTEHYIEKSKPKRLAMICMISDLS